MEDDKYDEFGNYIGNDIDMNLSDEDNSVDYHHKSNNLFQDEEAKDSKNQKWMDDVQDIKNASGSNRNGGQDEDEDADEQYYKKGHEIVLHEDKQYYPDADKLFGAGVETLVMDEDAQPLTQPIIEPPKGKAFHAQEKEVPTTTFSWEYLSGLSTNATLIRSVSICGHMHSGKTLLCDMLVQQTHTGSWSLSKEVKWTDIRKDEAERGLSIKCTPLTLVIPDSRGKSWLFNMMDTPGHPNFSDEVTASMRICDSVLLVVDCIEGVTFYTQRLIREALLAQMEIVVVINKMDRFVLELKLPASDAYYKIRHTLDEINFYIQTFHENMNKKNSGGLYNYEQLQISPGNGNVVFASTMFSCCFTLESFARKYQDIYNPQNSNRCDIHSREMKNQALESSKFAKFLWGDLYYEESTRKFKRSSEGGLQRSFVHFILEPFYKLISLTISNEKQELQPVLKKLNIFLNKKDFLLDIKPLLKLVLSRFFGDISCLVDAMTSTCKSVVQGTKTKVQNYYRNSNDNAELAQQISLCDPKGPLCVNITKLFTNEAQGGFYAFGRIFSGTLKVGDNVKVMGEGYTLEEEEDLVVKRVNSLWISEGRYKVEVDKIGAGNWVLIDGVDQSINKTATLTSANFEGMDIFKPLDFNTEAIVKVACEPLNPSELPKMLDGLRKINKSYPLAKTKVEQSGEHIIHGTGELYMDSIFHDLRKLYAEIEIKVSEPFVSFSETVVDASSVRCTVESSNKKNALSMIAEPLDKGLAEYIEQGTFDLLPDLLVSKFGWDELTASSIWAFGPNQKGTNMLIDYTLSTEVDKQRLGQVRDSIVQGFQWSTREGPLCEEPIKNVKFKILHGMFANEPIQRGGSQIIPASRRVCYSSFLLASPRIMEPFYVAEVYCPHDCIEAVYNVLIRRRAHVTSEEAKPGSPLSVLKIEIPVIESFGFETDLRTHTIGSAMVLQMFSHWSVAPGDPLDKTIQLRPLEPSLVPQLAREFMVKSRRRKGLLEDVSISKFFDNATMIEMARQDPQLHSYF